MNNKLLGFEFAMKIVSNSYLYLVIYLVFLRLRLDPLFWKCILENAFMLECILENAFSRMHFDENSAFSKILKLFIRSDYVEKNCVWLVF